MKKVVTVFCLCLCAAQRLLAWNAEGHMVVSQIAYNHLDASVKTQCDVLIAAPLTYASSQSSSFVTAAVWADDFRTQLGSALWHYIDLPFSVDNTSTNGFSPANSNVVAAINQCMATFLSNDPSTTNRAMALRYLLHFVGDIHQPLHCSTELTAEDTNGDAGGNTFFLTNAAWSNLHSLWDSGGGWLTNSASRPLSGLNQSRLDAKIAAAEAIYPYVRNTGSIPNPMSWALEGRNLSMNVAYIGVTQNTTPSPAYLNTAQSTAQERLALGGHRLADLLNTLLSTDPVVLSSNKITNGKFNFSWLTIPGRSYRVQWKGRLSDSWQDRTNILATTNTISFNESLIQTQRFYRVVR
jgi:hypothetical protein